MYNLCTALKYGSLFPELYLFDSENYNAYLYKSPKIDWEVEDNETINM
ncbi:MAG: spore coat associated protein CotJA [Paeniclostridium sp.]